LATLRRDWVGDVWGFFGKNEEVAMLTSVLHSNTGGGAVPLPVHDMAAGEVLFRAGEQGGLWRVRSGLIRLDRVGNDSAVLVMLAQAGDLLGFESLCGQGYQLQASAFNDVVLQPLNPDSAEQRQQWLIEAVLQQPLRSHDMARVRTGQVAERLGELLRLLGHSPVPGFAREQPLNADAVRNSLPPLRVLAEVVDAKPETVCRALAQLLPPRSKKSGPRNWKAASAAAGAVAAQALGLVPPIRPRC
jgi:hypothetical protein